MKLKKLQKKENVGILPFKRTVSYKMGTCSFRMQLFLILIVAASNLNAVRIRILPFWLAAAIRLTQIPGEQRGNCLWHTEAAALTIIGSGLLHETTVITWQLLTM